MQLGGCRQADASTRPWRSCGGPLFCRRLFVWPAVGWRLLAAAQIGAQLLGPARGAALAFGQAGRTGRRLRFIGHERLFTTESGAVHPSLHDGGRYGSFRRHSPAAAFAALPRRCRSSVVEHPLGKGEVNSSILFGSTSPSRGKYRLQAARCGGLLPGGWAACWRRGRNGRTVASGKPPRRRGRMGEYGFWMPANAASTLPWR